MELDARDIADLRRAKRVLENPGLAIKLSSLVGTPIEKGIEMLPEGWGDAVTEATRRALEKALDVAVRSMDTTPGKPARSAWHSAAAAVSGGAGGLFGLGALAVELPISTTIMLRSIADIARSEGEDLETIEARLECLSVFALGGTDPSDDAAEAGYFTARLALAEAIGRAAQHVAKRGVSDAGAPALVKLVAAVAQRFSVQVSQKAAAQLIPVLGAAGGAIVNTTFITHFQEMAHGHFIVRRLERKVGPEAVREAYDQLVEPSR
ncbi:MAG: EcsC family protein [Planctomycetota bacterium]